MVYNGQLTGYERDRCEFGVPKDKWSHWAGLARNVFEHYRSLTDDRELIPEEQQKHDVKTLKELTEKNSREWFRKAFEDSFDSRYYTKEPVRRLNELIETDYSQLSQEDFEKINPYWRIDVFKKLDELADLCNASIRRAIYEGGPLEWELYLDCCKQAVKLFNGPEATSYLDEIKTSS